ncbi:MAG: hypothetical protein LBG92_08035, partial [Prevotellaceae bacterium]|nr:hypothetical protein [Prevotellaceae bacterium]
MRIKKFDVRDRDVFFKPAGLNFLLISYRRTVNIFNLKFKQKITVFFAAVMLTGAFSLNAQQQFEVKGKDFWLSFARNWYNDPTLNPDTRRLQIRFVSTDASSATTVKIELTKTGKTINVTIPPNGVVTQDMMNDQSAIYNEIDMEANNKKSIHITSDKDILVYALNRDMRSEDATNVLPTSVLGKEYIHLGRHPNKPNGIDGEWYEQYMVVATVNGTVIKENGTPVRTLNKGDVYFKRHTADMSGRIIEADQPVAYFTCLSRCNHGGYSSNGGAYGSNYFQQLMSTDKWGREFFVPATETGYEVVRIIASQPGTRVSLPGIGNGSTQIIQSGSNGYSVSGNTVTLPNKANWVELTVRRSSTDKGVYIMADKPVQVCSYMVGYKDSHLNNPRLDNYLTGCNSLVNAKDEWSGESLCLIPPVGQLVKNAKIAPFYSSYFPDQRIHKAIILVKTSDKDKTRFSCSGHVNLSNQLMSNWPAAKSDDYRTNCLSYKRLAYPYYQWYDSNNGWSYCDVDLYNGDNNQYSFENSEGLILLGYGYSGSSLGTSYFYNAYSGARDLRANFTVNGKPYALISGETICATSSQKMSFQASFNVTPTNVEWYIDGIKQTVSDIGAAANSPWTAQWDKNFPLGSHTVILKAYDGTDYKDYTATFTVNMKPSFTASISALSSMPVCSGTEVTFTATPSGMSQYVWKKNGTTISGATGEIYKTSALNDNDKIVCEVTSKSAVCGDTTVIASYDVNVIPSVTPSVSVGLSPNTNIPVCINKEVEFEATATNLGGGTALYRWFVDGSAGTPTTSNKYKHTFTSVGTKYIECELQIIGGSNCLSSNSVWSNKYSVTVQNCLTADDIFITTPKNTPVTINLPVQGNVQSSSGCTPITYSITGNPAFGSVSNFNPATGALTYVPNNNYVGVDGFEYKAECGGGSVTKKIGLFVYDASALQYIACPGVSVTMGFTPVSNIKFHWYDSPTAPAPLPNGTNTPSFTTTKKSGVPVEEFWVEIERNGIKYSTARIKVELIDNSANGSCGTGGALPACVTKGTLLFKEDFGGNEVNDPFEPPCTINWIPSTKYT